MIDYAYAKLNLTLEITKSAENGYHEISSLFQKINFRDRISIENSFMDEIAFNRKVFSKITTVHLARDLFREATSIIEPVNISVRKSIPVGSGLGGGSSDARATLDLMNKFFGNPLGKDALVAIGAKIGADIPFFFNGSTAFVSGLGDIVKPMANLKKIFLILVFPDFHSSTRIAYELFDRFGKLSSGEKTKKIVSMVSQDYSVYELNSWLYNDFEILFRKIDSRYKKLFESVEHICETKFHLTGSGSSIFALFETLGEATRTSNRLRKAGYKHIISETT
jgi:4-diphosphocytidyl-2-C-methyl-D-erythritol kinase